jgi:hypothetical protein
VEEIPRNARFSYAIWDNAGNDQDATTALPYPVNFTKQDAGSWLEVMFSSNLRTNGGGGICCRWALRVDDQNCNVPVNGNVYIWPGGNYHQHRTVLGICPGIAAGAHTLRPWIEQCPGYGNADCATGWNSMTYIGVREVPANQRIAYATVQNMNDGSDATTALPITLD